MNNEYEKIKEILSENIKIPNNYNGFIESTLKELPNKKLNNIKHKNIKLVFATTCCSIFLITGIVFSKDIENWIKETFWSNGIQSAINNGYGGNTEDDFSNQIVNVIENNEIIDTINVNTKVGEFLMTDSTINVEFTFEFDEKINDYIDLGKLKNGAIDYEGSHYMDVGNMFIVDEENQVLYHDEASNFIEYSTNNDVTILESQETYGGLSYSELSNYGNKIGCHAMLNVYNSKTYPDSKELNIYFTEIKFSPKGLGSDGKEITLEGNWEYHLELPASIYNRNSISYKATKYENTNFEIYEVTVSETRSCIGLKIYNLKNPDGLPEEIKKKNIELGLDEAYDAYNIPNEEEFLNLYGDKKFIDLFQDYFDCRFPIRLWGGGNCYLSWIPDTEGCYIITSNGNRFDWDSTTSGKRYAGYEEDGTTFDFYNYFEMTKYDATDEITLVIDFKGEPVHIKLEKQ